MPCCQSTADGPGLTVHIAGLVTTQEKRHSGYLVGHRSSLKRVQLPNLPLRTSRPGHLVHFTRHSSLNDSWTESIATNSSTGELVRSRLHDRDGGGFGGRVVCRTCVRAQTCRRSRCDDGARGVSLFFGRHQHTARCVFRSQEHTRQRNRNVSLLFRRRLSVLGNSMERQSGKMSVCGELAAGRRTRLTLEHSSS